MLVPLVVYFFIMSAVINASETQPLIYLIKSNVKQRIHFVSDHYALHKSKDCMIGGMHKRILFVEDYEWSVNKQKELEALMNNSLIKSIQCVSVSLPKKGVVIILFYSDQYDCVLRAASPFDSHFKGFIVEVYDKALFHKVLNNTQHTLCRT